TEEQKAEIAVELARLFSPGTAMSKHTPRYDMEGRLIESKLTMMGMEAGRRTFAYDEAGNKSEEVSYNENGTLGSKAVFAREYKVAGPFRQNAILQCDEPDAQTSGSFIIRVSRAPVIASVVRLLLMRGGSMNDNDQMAWHRRFGFDRRADQISAPKRDPGSVPEHLVAAEDVGERRKWHAPQTQIERLLDLIRPRHTVGQDKRRPDGEDLSVLFELDSPQVQLELPGWVLVVKGVADVDRFGKQFRASRDLPVKIFPKLPMVCDALVVVFFTLERQTDMLSTCGWCGRLCPCMFFHNAQDAAFASHHPFIDSKSNHKIR